HRPLRFIQQQPTSGIRELVQGSEVSGPGRLPDDMVEVEECIHLPTMELNHESANKDHGGQGEGHCDHAQLEIGDMVPVVDKNHNQEAHSNTSSSSNTNRSNFSNGEEQGLDTMAWRVDGDRKGKNSQAKSSSLWQSTQEELKERNNRRRLSRNS
ncbi:hypothetical protein AX774_g2934, partial [Zancudomyces culisetae]